MKSKTPIKSRTSGVTDTLQSLTIYHKNFKGEKIEKSKLGKEKILSINKQQEEKEKKMEMKEYYNDVQNCTQRVTNKIREMDDIDLNLGLESSSSEMSNQKRFLNDQAFRALHLNPIEHYMRKLSTQDKNKELIEIEDSLEEQAKNWKQTMHELGINAQGEAIIKKNKIDDFDNSIHDEFAMLEKNILEASVNEIFIQNDKSKLIFLHLFI
jgi:hypothetical protein